jgi:NADPH:quinone reductase-like Zn-dependent oxidoreductase
MRAMVLERQREPLRLAEFPDPVPDPGQVLIEVHACGVCRTDVHIVDGDLDKPKLPLVPGHQIVGEVIGIGPSKASEPGVDAEPREGPARRFEVGDRGALAGLDMRRVPLLPGQPREPL